MNHFDVVVVGGGAAGLSAALVLTRALRRVAVIDGGAPRNAPAAHMHGFLTRDGASPGELLLKGRREVTGYGGHILQSQVTDVTREQGLYERGEGFVVTLSTRESMTTSALLIATGLRDQLPEIPGLHARWGRDVLHCPYCHGYEVRNQPIAVIGGNSPAVQHAQLVRQWSADVMLFAQSEEPSEQQELELSARSIPVIRGRIRGLVISEDRLTALELEDGRVVPRTAIFVRPDFVPNDELLRKLGCEHDDDGWVVTDFNGRTTVDGVWAAGNVANPRAQVITASGEGSAAAISVNADLVQADIRKALHEDTARVTD